MSSTDTADRATIAIFVHFYKNNAVFVVVYPCQVFEYFDFMLCIIGMCINLYADQFARLNIIVFTYSSLNSSN